ncbi:MAG: hypothetical protein FWF05_09070 [Oscillospiraceae bacterium]|nr:hypothetical protein [Oscillospiraceae bacterium]
MKKSTKILCLTIAVIISLSALLLAGCNRATTTQTLNARLTDVLPDTFFTAYRDLGMRKDGILKGFGFTEAEFKAKFVDNYDKWTGNVLEIKLTNKNDFEVDVLGLDVKKNGSKKVYVSKALDATSFGIPANYDGETTVYVMVLAESSLGTESEILDQIKKMDIKVIYADKAAHAESLDEAKPADLKYDTIVK